METKKPPPDGEERAVAVAPLPASAFADDDHSAPHHTQTPEERLQIKIQTDQSRRSNTSSSGVTRDVGLSAPSSTVHSEEEHFSFPNNTDTVEDEEEPVKQQKERDPHHSAVGAFSVSPSTEPTNTNSEKINNEEVDLERADPGDENGTAAQEAQETATFTVVADTNPPEDAPAHSEVALQAYTAKDDEEYAKVVDDDAMVCLALHTKRVMCAMLIFGVLAVVAIAVGVSVSKQNGNTNQQQAATADAETTPITQENIQSAVNLWAADRKAAEKMYGHISTWDTSTVTSLTSLFVGFKNFNDDISQWNTSAVVSMSQMFREASSFDGDISQWDTSQVRFMEGLFRDASSFSGDLSQWDVSKVERMNAMFRGAISFTGSLCWDLSSITEATEFEHGFGACESSNIKTCHMFCGSGGSFDENCATITSEMIEAAEECPTGWTP